MSYIDSLSSETQALVMLNFEFFGKKLLLGVALLFSLFYIFYWRKHQPESPYLMVGIARTMLYIVSQMYLWLFPMFIFMLYPQVRIDSILQFMLLFYMIGFFVAGVIIFLNIMYIGPAMLTSIGGFNPDQKRTNKILNALFGKKAKEIFSSNWLHMIFRKKNKGGLM